MKWIDLPPVWLLGAAIMAWLVRSGQPPIALFLLGTFLVLCGIAFMAAALIRMLQARTTPIPHMQAAALVTSGIFAISRNPIYVGDLLILAGLCLRWGSYAGLLMVPALYYVLLKRFVLPEEERLAAKFGSAFAAYCQRTRRWI